MNKNDAEKSNEEEERQSSQREQEQNEVANTSSVSESHESLPKVNGEKDVQAKTSESEKDATTSGNVLEPKISVAQNENKITTNTSDQSSLISLMCRICYDDTLDEPIISPCNCKGTVGMVHKTCLERWLAESNTSKCDLCHHKFETERTTKYSVEQSFYRWLRYPPTNFAFPIRDMRTDLITCIILAFVSIMLIYLSLFAADYYNRERFSSVPVARWTAVSIMFMALVLILGFCTWIYLVLRYHCRVWYFWWQRETIVHIKNSVVS